MITPGNLLRLAVVRWLKRYCSQDGSIRQCFIRHSTAAGAQNPLLSDFDLAFFVDAADFDRLKITARRMRDMFRRTRILNCIALPATDAAYRMCASYYPLRSSYPMQNWFCVYGDRPMVTSASPSLLPFDHVPEAFLSTYIIPVIQGQKSRHVFEGALMRRKLSRDAMRATGRETKPAKQFYDVAVAEVALWDDIFGKFVFPSSEEPISGRSGRRPYDKRFEARWTGPECDRAHLRGVASLWVYPCFFDERTPYVVVNLTREATAEDCKGICATVLAKFAGLDFRLQIGTERSMLARLGGLSRVSLIDPWLFRNFGTCVFGNPDFREEICEPSIDLVKEKLQEYLLYLSYRVFCLRPYPYALYALAFTLDRLFQRRELILEYDELAEIYGKDFLPQSRLQGPEGRQRFFDAWKQLHRFDLF